MVRLRNREMPPPKTNLDRNSISVDQYDPVQLYQRYVYNLQMTPKFKDNVTTGRPKKVHQSAPVPIKPSTVDTKRSKIKSRVRSKPSLEIKTSRTKVVRPKTPTTKKKPVENLEDYEPSAEKKVTFEPNEIECFFDALKETVEEVVQAKLSSMVNTVVEILTKKIDEVSNKSQKTENTFSTLCGELNKKIMYYGEEHSRHFRYICMKLEYDKIYYQHINGLIHPDQIRPTEASQHTNAQQTKSSGQLQPPAINLFEAIPTCSHSELRSQTTRASVATKTGPYHAGDSAGIPKIAQTARQPSHSGPLNRVTVAGCKISRNCPKQVNKHIAGTQDLGDEIAGIGQSKSEDIALATEPCNDKDNRAQLGIKDFLNRLKMFHSNPGGRDALAKGDDFQLSEEHIMNCKQNSTPSVMDTDDTSSECLVSNDISVLSSEGNSTAAVEF